MAKRRFRQVDVFTDEAFRGNPVAVVIDAEGLDSATMQQIANWTNLSETTFVLPASNLLADYQLRIFTPRSELPFAGHPTIGTAHALLELGLVTPRNKQLIQECGAGLVNLHVDDSAHPSAPTITLTLPEAVTTPLTQQEVDRLVAGLGMALDLALPPHLVDVGPRWIVAKAASIEGLLAANPDYAKLEALELTMAATGSSIYAHQTDDDSAIEVRSFAPSCGLQEDPVCGSGNGSVAAFMRLHQGASPARVIVSSQGQCVGRRGRIALSISADAIGVGGQAVTCMQGVLDA
jgi:PhzF family phenazine biosynthesis protein